MLLIMAAFISRAQNITEIFLTDISKTDGEYIVGKLKNITNHKGYNNQPSFAPGDKSIFYVSADEGKQTDVYQYNIDNGKSEQITNTNESEYSPTILSNGRYFSTVRVESDGKTQRLWKFGIDGTRPQLISKNIKDVGYHCWIDDTTLALFILGESFTLQLANLTTEETITYAENIGRCIQNIPNKKAISFVEKIDSLNWEIKEMDLESKEIITVVKTLAGCEDYTWTKDGDLLMPCAMELYKYSPGKDSTWIQIADFTKTKGIKSFYRIAINGLQNQIALVGIKE